MTDRPLILIIDDHPSNRRLLRCQLESQSYGVLDAASGVEGLELFVLHQPSLVLLDIHMPHLSGMEVLRRLRELPWFSSVPCIAVTAMASPEERRDILAAGFDDYLAKPYFIHDLLRVVKRSLTRQQCQPMVGKTGDGFPLTEAMSW